MIIGRSPIVLKDGRASLDLQSSGVCDGIFVLGLNWVQP